MKQSFSILTSLLAGLYISLSAHDRAAGTEKPREQIHRSKTQKVSADKEKSSSASHNHEEHSNSHSHEEGGANQNSGKLDVRTLGHKADVVRAECMDFRFVHTEESVMELYGRENRADLIVYAGVALNVLNPDAWEHYFKVHFGLANTLHNVTRISLMDHEDCGAYKKKYGEKTPEEERKYHYLNLLASKMKILNELKTKDAKQFQVECLYIRTDGTVEKVSDFAESTDQSVKREDFQIKSSEFRSFIIDRINEIPGAQDLAKQQNWKLTGNPHRSALIAHYLEALSQKAGIMPQ